MIKKKKYSKSTQEKLNISLSIENKKVKDNPLPVISKSVQRSKVSKKFLLSIIFCLFVLLILIVPLLLIQLNIIQNPALFLSKKVQNFIIKDECSLVVGQLIHNIKDEGSCQLSCITRCNTYKLKYYNSTFKENVGDCNSCDCACK